MKLYLVQHGKARPKEEDPERSLSDEGKSEVEAVGKFLKRVGVKVTKIFHSGKLRALQTAEILAKHIGVEIEKADGLEPLAEIDVWIERIRDTRGDIMLVGHLPHLSRLANYLIANNQELDAISFRFGGVVCLEREESEDGKWRILWIVRPEIVR
jgi:phosphohistidine phosphatase